MRVQFVEDCEIEVLEDRNQDDGEYREFKKDQIVEFDIIDYGLRYEIKCENFIEDPSVLNVKFKDGKYAFGVMKEWFRCYY